MLLGRTVAGSTELANGVRGVPVDGGRGICRSLGSVKQYLPAWFALLPRAEREQKERSLPIS